MTFVKRWMLTWAPAGGYRLGFDAESDDLVTVNLDLVGESDDLVTVNIDFVGVSADREGVPRLRRIANTIRRKAVWIRAPRAFVHRVACC